MWDTKRNRDLFSPANCVLARRMKHVRKARVRRVRVWLWRRAWREVRGTTLMHLCGMLVTLNVMLWLWSKI